MNAVITDNTEEIFEGQDHEAAPAPQKAYSWRTIPELEQSFRKQGFLTAIVTLQSPRFRNYLKKPANMLHDRWVYLERSHDGALYRLGHERGLRQELFIQRPTKQAILTTHEPQTGRYQVIVFDMVTKSVISNRLHFEYSGASAAYDYLGSAQEQGWLEPVAA